jgi:D-sedoheptulose 7-phosphate isomerase
MHVSDYLKEVVEVAQRLPVVEIEQLVGELKALRERGGRLFLVGLGGSAANCSHAVNDFNRLCGIQASSPVDNSAMLTASANDEGWNHIFDCIFWKPIDALFVFSVGGGTNEVSTPIVRAVEKAKRLGMRILGVVGRDGGFTKELGDRVIIVPMVNPKHVTPHCESFQMVILHCLVSHPDLQIKKTKW